MPDVDAPARPANRKTRNAERLRVQALADDALVLAMRAGDEWAWSEFVSRARPVLVGFAARVGRHEDDAVTCVGDLVTRVALHLASPGAPVPPRLAPYLVRAAVRCHRQAARDRLRRVARYAAAARDDVGNVVSAHARRVSEVPPDDETSAARHAVARVVELLTAELRADDARMLTWRADGVPHRDVAAWMNLSYDAVAKRMQRLSRRLADRLPDVEARLTAAERAALARVLDRARRGTTTDGGT